MIPLRRLISSVFRWSRFCERSEAFNPRYGAAFTLTVMLFAPQPPGLFIVPRAKAEEMYHPETFGRRAVVVRRRTQLKAVPYFQPTPPSPLLLPAQQRRKDVQQIVGFAIRPLTAKKRQE